MAKKDAKPWLYVLGGSANTATIFDFDGVHILDGGLPEKTCGYLAHVSNIRAVLLSAPTKNNLGTCAALLEQDKPVPIITNTKALRTSKPGSSGEQVKAIQRANSKLVYIRPPVFSPKYQPYLLNQSTEDGNVSFYILAGDEGDAVAITKALASGNEAEVEKAAEEHGTIGVLLWRPALGDKPAIRVLISGTSSMARIQQSLDKAAKALPFLNAPVVKSKDALTAIPAPSPGVSRKTGKPLARPTAPLSDGRPSAAAARVPLRPAPPFISSSRLSAKASAVWNVSAPKAPIKNTSPATKDRPTPPAKTLRTSPAKVVLPSSPSKIRRSLPVKVRPTPPAKVRESQPAKVRPSPPAKTLRSSPVKVLLSSPAKIRPSLPANVRPTPPAKMRPSPPAKVRESQPAKVRPSPPAKTLRSSPVKVLLSPSAKIRPSPPVKVRESQPAKVRPSPPAKTLRSSPVKVLLSSPAKIRPSPPANVRPTQPAKVRPSPPAKIRPSPPAKVRPSPPVNVRPTTTAPSARKSVPPGALSAQTSRTKEAVVVKKTVGKMQRTTPSKPATGPPKNRKTPKHSPKTSVPVKKPSPSPTVARVAPVIPKVIVDLDDSVVSDIDQECSGGPEIVVISPTPESLRRDAEASKAKKEVPAHSESQNDGALPGKLDDDEEHVATGFEMMIVHSDLSPRSPFTPHSLHENGTLADISSNKSNAEADTTKPIGEVKQLSSVFKSLELNGQLLEDATLPFTSDTVANGFERSSDEEFEESPGEKSGKSSDEESLTESDSPRFNSHQKQNGGPNEISNTDQKQPRSSVIENGAQNGKTDPANDDILSDESEEVDAVHSETLHMPKLRGVVASPKPVKFARPYYFDVVTVPGNGKGETTLNVDGLTEFVSKIRSRKLILPSKEISSEQLGAILKAKQTYCEKTHPCHVIPTHQSSTLKEFRRSHEKQCASSFLTLANPIDAEKTKILSEDEFVAYQVAEISLEYSELHDFLVKSFYCQN